MFINGKEYDIRPGADLYGADLRSADLSGANFGNTESICPEGFFNAFKKTVTKEGAEFIVQLEIPKTAKRLNAIGSRKIRVERAKVVAHFTKDRKRAKGITSTGKTNKGIYYKDGEMVRPDKFDDDVRVECSSGIHCFLTFKEAAAW